jgi:hypothetical protein
MQSRSSIAVLARTGCLARARVTLVGTLVAACVLAGGAAPAPALISDAPVSSIFANGPVHALARAGDGSVYVGGDFTQICTSTTVCVNRARIAQISADGTLMPALGGSGLDTDTNGPVRALAVSPDKYLYAGGEFAQIGGIPIGNAIARWDGFHWQAMRTGLEGPVLAIAVSGPDVFVGGDFAGAAGSTLGNIAKWNGTDWGPVGLGATGPVHALTAAGSSVWAGGAFDQMLGASPDTGHIARWDGSAWQPLGEGIKGTYDEVRAIAVSGPDVYVGGTFTVPIGSGSEATNIAHWSGTAWEALGAGADGPVNAVALAAGELYIGGDFLTLGPVLSQRFAGWNGKAWSRVGAGADAAVRALAIAPDGSRLFAGGTFAKIGGRGHPNLAVFAPPAAADRVAPKLSATIAKQRLRNVLATGLKVKVTCDEALKVAVRASVRGRRMGEATRTLKAKTAVTVTVKLTASSARRLRRATSTPFDVTVSAVDKAGNHATATASRVLKR